MEKEELKLQIDTTITNKTLAKSISPLNVGGNMKNIIDLIPDNFLTFIEAGDNIGVTGVGSEENPYVISSTGGAQNLQSVINAGGTATISSTFQMQVENLGKSSNITQFPQELGLSNSISGKQTSLNLSNGVLSITEEVGANYTIVKFEEPIAPNSIINFPAKTITGSYTLATTDQLRPYKVYAVILNQVGTNPPIATVLENTLGDTLSFSYVAPGYYNVTSTLPILTGVMSPQQRTIHVNEQSEGTQLFSVDIYPSTSTNFNLGTRIVSGGESNDMFYETYLEFRVYD